MDRKIILKSGDFDREILSFFKKVGADIPLHWDKEVLERIKKAVIDTFAEMGVILEIDDNLQAIPPI